MSLSKIHKLFLLVVIVLLAYIELSAQSINKESNSKYLIVNYVFTNKKKAYKAYDLCRIKNSNLKIKLLNDGNYYLYEIGFDILDSAYSYINKFSNKNYFIVNTSIEQFNTKYVSENIDTSVVFNTNYYRIVLINSEYKSNLKSIAERFDININNISITQNDSSYIYFIGPFISAEKIFMIKNEFSNNECVFIESYIQKINELSIDIDKLTLPNLFIKPKNE